MLFDSETPVDEALPSAFGIDLGGVYKPTANLVFNANLRTLFSEQEFVYVGDGGVVEPSGASRRFGVDLGSRYQVNKWWYANLDVNYTLARS